MAFRIARLNAELVPTVQALNKEVLQHSPQQRFYDQLAANPTFGAIAYSSHGLAIGAITCRLVPDKPEVLYIATLAVLPSFQSQGAGRMLVRHVCTLADSIELKFVDAHIWSESYLAYRFYQRLGFHENGRIDEYYMTLKPPGAVVMRRSLNETCVEW